MSSYITAGQLAKLASTTKRTILFYDEKGILNPVYVNKQKYRFYKEEQVLDYQKILLLTSLGISLTEMKKYLQKKGDLTSLFNTKKSLIKQQISKLEWNLNNLEKFLLNMKSNGTMVAPVIKNISPFGVYYIEKIGSYAKICEYCNEILSMFKNNSKPLTTLSIFYNPTYQPKKSLMRIGVLKKTGLKIKDQYKEVVKYMKYNPRKVITYTHNGSGSLLSLFWKELEKYCRLHKIKINKSIPDFEIYREVNDDVTKQFFEIYLPIK